MPKKRSAVLVAILDLMADNEWHKASDIATTFAHLCPPEIAVKYYRMGASSRRNATDIQVNHITISKGRIYWAADKIRDLRRYANIEARGKRGDRQYRLLKIHNHKP